MSNKNRRFTSNAPLWGRKQRTVDRIKDLIVLLSAAVLLITQAVSCTDNFVNAVRAIRSESGEVVPVVEPESESRPSKG
jgi:hypothetical protein